MIILSQTTDTVKLVLAGSVTTNQVRCMTSWRDITTSAYTAGRTVINSNNTTAVTIVGSPASSTQRVVDLVNVYNYDTSATTVTISFDDNGTSYILWSGILNAGERLEYTEGQGFRTFTSRGALKTVNTLTVPTVGDLTTVVLASDVVNNNAVANTIIDITGLEFPVVAGNTYWFRFTIDYTSAATSTGSRWSITGPAFDRLSYTQQWSLAATTTSNGTYVSYDFPTASNTSSPNTTGNIAVIDGFITPSADGTVTGRFASEVSGSAITAKAGSIVRYMQVI